VYRSGTITRQVEGKGAVRKEREGRGENGRGGRVVSWLLGEWTPLNSGVVDVYGKSARKTK